MYRLTSLRIHRFGIVFGRNVFGQRWIELWKGDLTPAVVVTIDRRQTKQATTVEAFVQVRRNRPGIV